MAMQTEGDRESDREVYIAQQNDPIDSPHKYAADKSTLISP